MSRAQLLHLILSSMAERHKQGMCFTKYYNTVLSPFVLSPSFVPHFYAPHPVLFTAIHCVVIVVKTWRK